MTIQYVCFITLNLFLLFASNFMHIGADMINLQCVAYFGGTLRCIFSMTVEG